MYLDMDFSPIICKFTQDLGPCTLFRMSDPFDPFGSAVAPATGVQAPQAAPRNPFDDFFSEDPSPVHQGKAYWHPFRRCRPLFPALPFFPHMVWRRRGCVRLRGSGVGVV